MIKVSQKETCRRGSSPTSHSQLLHHLPRLWKVLGFGITELQTCGWWCHRGPCWEPILHENHGMVKMEKPSESIQSNPSPCAAKATTATSLSGFGALPPQAGIPKSCSAAEQSQLHPTLPEPTPDPSSLAVGEGLIPHAGKELFPSTIPALPLSTFPLDQGVELEASPDNYLISSFHRGNLSSA